MRTIMILFTKIVISISAIIAISGKAVDLGPDMDRPSDQVTNRKDLLDVLSRLKLIIPDYDKLDFLWPSRTRLDVFQTSPMADTTHVVSQHESQRERRQALVKARGTDGGSGSLKPFANYSFPLNMNGDDEYLMTNFGITNKILQELGMEIIDQFWKSRNKF